MGIRTEVAVISNKGCVRGNNEDNFFINGAFMPREEMDKGGLFEIQSKDEHQLYAVCDGMGGIDSGEEASLSAVMSLQELLARGDSAFESSTIASFIQITSDKIYTQSVQRGNGRSGCTIVMMVIDDGYVRLMHVGDSRIYRLRGDEFKRMTKDHSEVQRLINLNRITEEEARTHPMRNVITQYLGVPPTEISLSPGITQPDTLEKGDMFLLCSDGVTDMVEDTRIGELMKSVTNASEACKKIVDEAMNNGGNDNITAMCVRVVNARPGGRLSVLKMQSYGCICLAGLNLAALAACLVQLIK